MLSRKFYDMLTIVFIIVLIGSIVYIFYSTQKSFLDESVPGDTDKIEGIISGINLKMVILGILSIIYYIFIPNFSKLV